MDPRKQVFTQTGIVAVGVAVCTAAMVGVFALVKAFDLSVLWGALAGAAISILNFFFMALVVTVASQRAVSQDPESGKKLIRSSYPLRYLALGAVLFLLGSSGLFNVIALVIPLVFVRPVLTVAEFFRKKGE